MTQPPLDDEDRRIMAALERAAQRARRVAAQTGTHLIVVRDGVLTAERVPPMDPPKADPPVAAPRP